MESKNKKREKGALMIYMIVAIAVFAMIMFPLTADFTAKIWLMRSSISKEQALQVAEAGINYYQWHLAHFNEDYQDGTGGPGPYLHDYIDYDAQQKIGQFSLEITPPSAGSTIVTIKSTGWLDVNPNLKRTVTVRYGIPSLAKYAFLSHDVIWIGENETIGGQLHSNNGIRFDGTGTAPIQSSKTTYICPSSQGWPCPTLQNGVWGSAPDSTKAFWQWPVPTVDFSSITSDLADMKSDAEGSGIYLPPSNEQGYSLVFNSNGTVSIYKITSLLENPAGLDTSGRTRSEYTDYNTRVLQFTQDLPDNGIIYIEDKTWVEGTINGRVAVVSAKLPYNFSTAPSIYVPNNVLYAEKDGTDVLGLISQKDIIVTYRAPADLEIDAALVAQNGAAQFFYYSGNIKNSITTFGSLMSFVQWTWTWVSGYNNVVSGYKNTYSNYDGNLLYAPPPDFPFSSSGYQLLSWSSD